MKTTDPSLAALGRGRIEIKRNGYTVHLIARLEDGSIGAELHLPLAAATETGKRLIKAASQDDG